MPVSPDVLKQSGTGNRLPSILDKVTQQPGLTFGKLNQGPGTRQLGPSEVHSTPGELVIHDLGFLVPARPDEQRLDPSLELLKVHRFDQVVVRAGLENRNALRELFPSRQDNHGRLDIP